MSPTPDRSAQQRRELEHDMESELGSEQENPDAWRSAPIVLGSASPRRRDLLTEAGVAHVVSPANIDERAIEGEHPREMTLRLAREKASTVAKQVGKTHRRLVLGSDTIVVLHGVVFGKPADADDAMRLLRALTGRTHEVITGVAIVDSSTLQVWECAVSSQVTLRAAEDSELRRYIATGEPLDKAGAYAIQGDGKRFVSGLTGSRSNVIGLPVEETLELIRRAYSESAPAGGAHEPGSEPSSAG